MKSYKQPIAAAFFGVLLGIGAIFGCSYFCRLVPEPGHESYHDVPIMDGEHSVLVNHESHN